MLMHFRGPIPTWSIVANMNFFTLNSSIFSSCIPEEARITPLRHAQVVSDILLVQIDGSTRYVLKGTSFPGRPEVKTANAACQSAGVPEVFLAPLQVEPTEGGFWKLYEWHQMVSPQHYLETACATISRLHQHTSALDGDPEQVLQRFLDSAQLKCLDRVRGTQYERHLDDHLRRLVNSTSSGADRQLSVCHLDPHAMNLLEHGCFIDTDNVAVSLPEIDLGMVGSCHRRLATLRAGTRGLSDVAALYPGYEDLDHSIVEAVSRIKDTMNATWNWHHGKDTAAQRIEMLLDGDDGAFPSYP